MAINKNNFKNAEGNYEAKNTLMDAVIDGVNGNEADLADYAKEATQLTLDSDDIYDRTGCTYYKKNGYVSLFFTISKKNTQPFEIGEIIATLPVGFPPKDDMYMIGMRQMGGARNPIAINIYRSGPIQVGSSTTDTSIRVCTTYYAGGGTV